ncbi:MAG: hypothetical protein AAB693_01810 [Patescibacteria group bacterium]
MPREEENIRRQGQTMLVTILFFLTISLFVIFSLVPQATTKFIIANNSIQSKQSFLLAESGTEDAYYQIKKYNDTTSPITLPTLNSGTVTTTIINQTDGTKIISATGDVASKQRKSILKTKPNSTTKATLKYGSHIGTGGLKIDGGNTVITGDVYSNGPVSGGSGTGYKINGDVTSAGNNGSVLGYDKNKISFTENVFANTINKSKLNTGKTNNCNIGSNNNPACVTMDLSFIPIKPLNTINAAIINELKTTAAVNTYTGNVKITNQTGNNSNPAPITQGITCTTNSNNNTCKIGPVKITGNLTLESNADVTLTGPVYVVGNIILKGSSKITLNSSYGSNKIEIMLAEKINASSTTSGKINVSDSFKFLIPTTTPQTTNSYIMLLTEADFGGDTNGCTSSTGNSGCAISFVGGDTTGEAILNAQNGGIALEDSPNMKQITANFLSIKGSAKLGWPSTSSSIEYGISTLSNITSWQEE